MNSPRPAATPQGGLTCAGAPPPGPLALVAVANLRCAWRRLVSVRRQSKLLTALIASFLGGYALMAFWMFRIGLRFVGAFPGLGQLLVERLMFLLFAFLLVLLLFSNLVINYTNLFRNRETVFLLSLPIPARTVFQWKFMESALLASWAFLFLIAPLLMAYGLYRHVAWHFYLATPLLIGLFVILPAVAGSWVAVHLARFVDRRVFQILAFAALLVGASAALAWVRTVPAQEAITETRVTEVLDRLLARTHFAEFPWLPSYWLSAGVLQWSEGALAGALFFALVLLSYVLFFGYLAFTRTGGLFYEAISAVHSRGSVLWQWPWFQAWQRWRRRCSYSRGGVETVFGLARVIPSDLRALLVKDVRVFWRDTSQWGQTLVLFGLLGVYILNLRHFSHQLSNPFWIHLVSFLNLGACSLNLATLTTRFVYPQFSLEGKRLWIVGMAPAGLARVVVAKYWLASLASLTVTLGLIWLSCHMLEMPPARTLYFSAAVTVMTLTLNALATGLGVLYPNFREDNPSKIVSGFGGTFCLVLSFVYIVGVVVLLALGSPWSWSGPQESHSTAVLWAWCLFGLASLALGWLPLRLALRRVARFEL